MSLHEASFDIHDISGFPLVRFRNDRAVDGYAVQWQREMEALLAYGQAFAILYADPRHDEHHEDRKQRGMWLKHNKDALASLCKGLATVEPDPAQRARLSDMAAGNTRAFGVRQVVEASIGAAETRLLALLADADA